MENSIDRCHWRETVAALGVAAEHHADTIATFHRLDRAYRQPWRAYHTLAHLKACLALCNHWRSHLSDPAAVAMALWFHDAVYVPQRTDNERRSAQWASAILQCWQVNDQRRSWIDRAILATQHHQLSDASDRDQALVLDIDLSILAAPTAEFDRYERAIRQEYHWVEAAAFRRGRLAVLRSFLERDRLFVSPPGFATLEQPARANLVRAIERLQSRSS